MRERERERPGEANAAPCHCGFKIWPSLRCCSFGKRVLKAPLAWQPQATMLAHISGGPL